MARERYRLTARALRDGLELRGVEGDPKLPRVPWLVRLRSPETGITKGAHGQRPAEAYTKARRRVREAEARLADAVARLLEGQEHQGRRANDGREADGGSSPGR